VPIIVAGAAISAGLAIGLGLLFQRLAISHESADIGPTAATLDEAFGLMFGGALGVFVGAGAAAAAARRGPRMPTGLLAAGIGYVLIVFPVVLVAMTTSGGSGVRDSIDLFFLVGVPLTFAALIGSVVGVGVGAVRAAAVRLLSRNRG
jgi:hypothetical protein